MLPRSCHPPHIHKNIPYSLALRIKRICSRDSDFIKRSNELRRMLLARKYKLKDINVAIDRAATMNRKELLKIKNTKTNSKTNFVFPFCPQLPSISKVINRHHKQMSTDPELKRVFKSGFQTAYSRDKNLKEYIYIAKLWPQNRQSQ